MYISMTKFSNQELISNYSWINPKLNSNKLILCFKKGMHPTEAEGQNPVLDAASKNAERHSDKRHNATIGITRKDIAEWDA